MHTQPIDRVKGGDKEKMKKQIVAILIVLVVMTTLFTVSAHGSMVLFR
jgi:PhoPQ-activated pathogenicity-related protein